MGNHCVAVNAGIGASGTGDGDVLVGDCFQGILYVLLDGWSVGLYLPSVEWGAVIAELTEEA